MTKYSDVLDFSKLPLETRIDILATLSSYSECHVELFKNGTRRVTPDWCICGSDYDRPEIEHEFKKESFDENALRLGLLLKFGRLGW